jgi:hypothetical protein
VKVDVYRSCSWREKRDVLNVFWRTNIEATARIVEAALQYGYYAVVCLVVVMLEIAVIFAATIGRYSFVAGLSVAAELFMMWSTWWAIKRYRSLKTHVVV